MAAHAEDPGKFIILRQNECAPFEGVLFDPVATAEILDIKVYAKRECELKLEHELKKKDAGFQLERDKLNIRYDALKEEHKLLIEKKDYEITQLRESLIKQSPRNNWLWAAGGVVVGMATTYGAYRMFNDD
jgi:hypothetical protein